MENKFPMGDKLNTNDLVPGNDYSLDQMKEIFGDEFTEDTRILVVKQKIPEYIELTKLSEIIAFLKQLQDAHGDLNVQFSSDIEGNQFSNLTNSVGKEDDTIYLYRA